MKLKIIAMTVCLMSSTAFAELIVQIEKRKADCKVSQNDSKEPMPSKASGARMAKPSLTITAGVSPSAKNPSGFRLNVSNGKKSDQVEFTQNVEGSLPNLGLNYTCEVR